jgi:hypothetical protein
MEYSRAYDSWVFVVIFLEKGELAIIELFLAGILISTATMDSPLWGATRLLLTSNALWHWSPCEPPPPHNENTTGWPLVHLGTWIEYYYNPMGSYVVWAFSQCSIDPLERCRENCRSSYTYRMAILTRKEAPISSLKELVFRRINSDSKRE